MQRMTWSNLLIMAAVVGLVGCATYPPPIILPEKATNFKYQYSVDIPQGWDVYEKFPKDLENFMPQAFKKVVTLVMVNKDSKGMIALANDKRRESFQALLNAPVSKFNELPLMLEKKSRKTSKVTRWDSTVNIENLAETYRNYKENKSSFNSEAIFQIEVDIEATMGDATLGVDWFIYPCHTRNFCQTVVLLASQKEKYTINRPAFESVVESLTMHDIPDN